MTTNHPVPTPPPAEPAPSLRPVEEPDLAALVRWVQSLPTTAAEAAAAEFIAPLLARLRAAEETLAAVERLAAIYERTAEVDPTGEFRKRAAELRAALAEGASR